jgi:hypothetical protein
LFSQNDGLGIDVGNWCGASISCFFENVGWGDTDMQKLRKSDIVIKSPGLQIREKIQRDYGDLKTFANIIDMSESSVDQYLTHKNMGSSTFKIRLTRELGQDFRSLYKSDQEQVESLIERFMAEVARYEQLSELQMAEGLHALVKACDVDPWANASAYYGQALYREACGEPEKALGYLSRGIALLRGSDGQGRTAELLAVMLTRMIWIERLTASKEKLFKDLQNWSVFLKLIESRNLKAEICLTVSKAFLDRNEMSTAQFYGTMAEDLAESDYVKGKVKLNSVLMSGDLETCRVAIEEAERLLRGASDSVPELLLARARLSEKVNDGRESLNYLHMAMDRCGRKLTAHSSELSAMWFRKLLEEITDDIEYERALRAHVLRLVSELGKGYKCARSHMNETFICLGRRPLSALGAFELLKDLGRIQHPESYHQAISELYYKLLGKLAANAFGSAIPEELLQLEDAVADQSIVIGK